MSIIIIFYPIAVCTKTVGTTLDILSDVHLCYAGHYQATQDIFKKQKYKKQNLFSNPFIHISYTMDNMTLTYMNKCICFFPKFTRNLARFLQLVL